jgi:hypothetical protein
MCAGNVEKRMVLDIRHCNDAIASTLRVSSGKRRFSDGQTVKK